MSLINQMLQDLDKRHSENKEGDAVSSQIRAVPENVSRQSIVWLGMGLLVIGVAALLWWLLHQAQPVPNPKTLGTPVVSESHQPEPMDALKQAQSLHIDLQAVHQEATRAQRDKTTTSLPDTTLKQANTTSAEVLVNSTKPDVAVKSVAMINEKENAVSGDNQTVVIAESKQKTLLASPVAPGVINKQVKELTPQQRAENEYRKAIALMQQGRVIEAISGLEQTLLINANHATARQTMVGLLLESKRQAEAERKLQEGLNIDPAQSGFAMLLARLQVERGDAHGGVVTLQNSLTHAAGRADYVAFLAALLQREGRHKEAIDHYMQAVRLSPQSGVWWMGLGISLQVENRLNEAQDAFNRAKASGSLSPELQSFVEQKLKQIQR